MVISNSSVAIVADKILMIKRQKICLMATLLLAAIIIHFLYLLHIQPIPQAYYRSSPEHHSGLRIATLNLRVPFPIDIQHNLSWIQRRSSIISTIHHHQPHILAVQEDCYFMNQDIMNLQYGNTAKKRLSDIYNRYGLFNRNGESHPSSSWPVNAFSLIVGNDGEHNSVYYNRHVYESLDSVTFWLSYTPNVAGSSFDEVTGRIVNCVLLQEKTYKSRRSMIDMIFFCSTHFPSNNITRQLLSVDVLSQMFSQYQTEFINTYMDEEEKQQLTMMIAGDFNAIPNSQTYNAMVKSGFVDIRQLAKVSSDYTYTTNDWYGAKDSLIDYVWIYQPKGSYHHSGSNSNLLSDNVQSVKHISIPCYMDDDTSAELEDTISLVDDNIHNKINRDNNKTASDHLMVVVDFNNT